MLCSDRGWVQWPLAGWLARWLGTGSWLLAGWLAGSLAGTTVTAPARARASSSRRPKRVNTRAPLAPRARPTHPGTLRRYNPWHRVCFGRVTLKANALMVTLPRALMFTFPPSLGSITHHLYTHIPLTTAQPAMNACPQAHAASSRRPLRQCLL